MKRKYVSCLTMIIVIIVSSSVTSADFIIEKPTYTVGDFWKYKYVHPERNGSFERKVVAIENVKVQNITYQSYRIEENDSFIETNISMGQIFHFQMLLIEHISVKDFAIIKIDTAMKSGFIKGPSHNQTENCTVEYNPPLEWMRFPIIASKSWNITTLISGECSGFFDGTHYGPVKSNGTYFTKYYTESPLNITVPAGSFKAIRIISNTTYNSSTSYGYSDQLWSKEVGAPIEESTNSTTHRMLVEYRYSYASKPTPECNETLCINPIFFYFVILLLVVVPIVFTIIVIFIIRKKNQQLKM